jgi:hypothetical protein
MHRVLDGRGRQRAILGGRHVVAERRHHRADAVGSKGDRRQHQRARRQGAVA